MSVRPQKNLLKTKPLVGRCVSLSCDLTLSLGGKSIPCKLIIKMKKRSLVNYTYDSFIHSANMCDVPVITMLLGLPTHRHTVEAQDGGPLISQSLFGQYSNVIERLKV